MFKSICWIAIAFALPFSMSAKADGVSATRIGSSVDSAGDNWSVAHTWNVRTVLLDSSHTPIGKLSPPITFDTHMGASTPTNFTATLESAAPAGSIFRVYRSRNPFNVGDTGIEYADYAGLCPCGTSPMFVPTSGQLRNPDFANTGVTLPVRLQDFSAE